MALQLHCIALHCIAFHDITLHDISIPFHSIPLHYITYMCVYYIYLYKFYIYININPRLQPIKRVAGFQALLRLSATALAIALPATFHCLDKASYGIGIQ